MKTDNLDGTGLPHALHYLQILAFAVTAGIFGLNVKHYGMVHQNSHFGYEMVLYE